MGGSLKLFIGFFVGLIVAAAAAWTFMQPRQLNITPPSQASADLETAWAGYLDAVDQVTQNFLASDTYSIDSAHRAGAIELLQAIMAGNLNGVMSGGDGGHPYIRLVLSPSMKLGVDNPDTFYRGATISNPDGDAVYRVWGNRGTASDFLLEQFYGPDPNGAISVFEDEDLVMDADGNFELFLSAERRGINWMPLPRDDRLLLLMFRDSFTNWETEQPATLHIERLGDAGTPSVNLDEGQLIRQIDNATQILLRQGQFWPEFSNRLRYLGENNFTAFRATGDLGILSQYFAPGFFSLGEDEALLVTIPDVDAGYCGFQLTSFWSASPDWPNRQSSLSWCNEGAQAHQSEDGSYTFIISPKDPGYQNWIDTSGNTQGVLYIRIQSPSFPLDAAPTPISRKISISDIDAEVPSDMPKFSAEDRARQIKLRQEHARRRYQTW
ncbi:MAG: DUF1214 domain-containing protein [Pseudomonadota bacterium]